jgi:hypothetical protein
MQISNAMNNVDVASSVRMMIVHRRGPRACDRWRTDACVKQRRLMAYQIAEAVVI